jgi:hypothetical protein
MRYHSSTPDIDARGVYAAKLGNLTAINSGQISADPANIGTVSWTYQASKGNLGATGSAEKLGTQNVRTELHNGWRSMAGEADLGLFGALKIISADVAADPVFGLVGYGCEVVRSGSVYEVSPRDGIGQRVNVLPLKLYLQVQQDQIVASSLAKDRVELTLKSRKAGAHANEVSLEGMDAGTYGVWTDGVRTGTVTASAGKTMVVPFQMGAAATTTVVVQSPTTMVEPPRPARAFTAVRDGRSWWLHAPDRLAGEQDARLVLRDAAGTVLGRFGASSQERVRWTPSRGGFVVATLEGGKSVRKVGSFLAW